MTTNRKQDGAEEEQGPGSEEPMADAAADPAPRGPKLEPIGSVRRTLVRPDGTKVSVDVPVYPPFRLESGTPPPPKPPLRRPSKGTRPRRTGSD
jgi:hypothetical protein